ncbi:MAG: regulatory iron-sulfur-containing complex subunit RicT [Candidatus Falkowbacteria bacterium]
MRLAKIRIMPWDKSTYADPAGVSINTGEWAVVKTDQGAELGQVLGFEQAETALPTNADAEGQNVLVRRATIEDLEKIPDAERRQSVLAECRQLVAKHNLAMKLIDVHFSLDGSKLTIAFIADGRVDFRDLVKDMTRSFNRTIRLQQIGIRDEARLMGDCGHCGKTLCCRTHLKDFASITSEMAEAQQCEHRGSDRISGACGRLMCCLAYELPGYVEMSKSMPQIGSVIVHEGVKGEVLSHHYLKGTVSAKFPDVDGRGGYAIIEVPVGKDKK